MAQLFWYALTSSNINRFLKLFHCQNQEKICNKNYKSLKIPPHLKCVATLPGVGGCLIFYLNLVYSHQWGQLDLKISGRKGCPIRHSCCHETCGVRMWAQTFVLSQITRLSARRTDRFIMTRKRVMISDA